ncbi:hypothetical protein A4X09_0g7721 [Tilletia walkeri]|uniref:Uncharacterized protein n=1 Tax=Tilletia walkeri TaxID=117179 RepID=A0A8X7N1E6_9BASI|nr:hypothetical protein A4X09_0g7721 [Tilletia walkeri]
MGTFAWENWCDEELRTSEREYVHSKLADYSLGNVEDFANLAAEAVGLYEDLVKTNREQYEPLLAEALFLHFWTSFPTRPFQPAGGTLPRSRSTSAPGEVENDMVKLPFALDEALIHQEALEYRFSIWRGYDTVASLNSARARRSSMLTSRNTTKRSLSP